MNIAYNDKTGNHSVTGGNIPPLAKGGEGGFLRDTDKR